MTSKRTRGLPAPQASVASGPPHRSCRTPAHHPHRQFEALTGLVPPPPCLPACGARGGRPPVTGHRHRPCSQLREGILCRPRGRPQHLGATWRPPGGFVQVSICSATRRDLGQAPKPKVCAGGTAGTKVQGLWKCAGSRHICRTGDRLGGRALKAGPAWSPRMRPAWVLGAGSVRALVLLPNPSPGPRPTHPDPRKGDAGPSPERLDSEPY